MSDPRRDQERPYSPPLSFRVPSALVMGCTGFLSRTFLYLLSTTETHGLDRFLEILDSRQNESKRERGLITVSNHLSVLDDPMIWGTLPFRYQWDPNNLRWGLGSYDICFKNGFTSTFFTWGQTLPTQRHAHSQFGGLFQPTMTEGIRLLSDPHGHTTTLQPDSSSLYSQPFPSSDPFSSAELTYSTNGLDTFPAPSIYPNRRHSWIHIFPEGMIHQHPRKVMRYFKWGIARLILEAEPCPDVLPMWIDGPQEVMSEKREWPRPVPRPGKSISISFGELVDREAVLEPFRERWRELVAKSQSTSQIASASPSNEGKDQTVQQPPPPPPRFGELTSDFLKYSTEAEQLRIDLTLAIRNEVLKVRRSRGLPDEDPKRGLAETWRKEGRKYSYEEGEMEDQSVVKDM